MKLFIGKLSFSTTSETLSAFFEEFGPVQSAKVITDGTTGRSRGFGFVELEEQQGQRAISVLNGQELDGRQIVVSEARPMNSDSRRSGGTFAPRERRDNHARY